MQQVSSSEGDADTAHTAQRNESNGEKDAPSFNRFAGCGDESIQGKHAAWTLGARISAM